MHRREIGAPNALPGFHGGFCNRKNAFGAVLLLVVKNLPPAATGGAIADHNVFESVGLVRNP
jgi:hypothetical protein